MATTVGRRPLSLENVGVTFDVVGVSLSLWEMSMSADTPVNSCRVLNSLSSCNCRPC